MSAPDWGAVERAMVATLVKKARDGDTAAARRVLDYIERQRGAASEELAAAEFLVDQTMVDRETYLVTALRQLESLAEVAAESNRFEASVAAKKQAILVRADLDQLRHMQLQMIPPESIEAHKSELRQEVRRRRIAATGIAAAQLLKLERDLIASDEAEQRQAEADRLANAPDEDLLEEARALLVARLEQ